MASIYIGVNRGHADNPDNISENSSTNSTDIELRIDTGKSLTRNDVVLLTERILEYLTDGRTATFPL